MPGYQHLLQEGRIGSMSLKNRMVVSAMGVNLAEEDGSCGERLRAFHEEQARGGAGLIVLGSAGVAWPHGGNQPRQAAISEDRHIPGMRALADAVHAHGAKVAAQLHFGGLVGVEDMKAGREVWIPSYPVMKPSDLGEGMLPEEQSPPPKDVRLHVMTEEDIAVLVRKFADAARRAREAGLDGVEIHGGHGYIISEFLSPNTNNRDDAYGGSLENRARLLVEIIRAVRDAVGGDFPVWCKLDTAEYGQSEGISLEDACETARFAEVAGVDAITASAYHDTSKGALHSESNIPHVPERMVPGAMRLKGSVNVPVIASGRIEPAAANRHIEKEHFDFFAMGRKLLADPYLPRKLSEGRAGDIRPCVYCYCCVSQIYIEKAVKCAVNPDTAFETDQLLAPTEQTKHIAVVGGGPAGMEAARRLRLRGHRVTLLEASSRLGGTLQFAAIAYEPNQRLLSWLRKQVRSADIDVRLNTAATPALLKSLQADEVIVATGARRDMPDLPGSDRDFVFSGDEMRAMILGEQLTSLRHKLGGVTRQLLSLAAATGATANAGLVRVASRAWLPLGRDIVIVGGELVGLELAEFLAHRGRRVSVIETAERPGAGLYLVRRLRLLAELRELGVDLHTGAGDVAIGEHSVSYCNFRGQVRQVRADQVIVARGAEGDNSVVEALSAAGLSVHAIGDCTGVGYIEGAMHEAAQLAARL